MTVTGEQDALNVTGNTCMRGAEYAIGECTHPMRTLTSTIRVSNRENTMVSVKTQEPIPKERLFEAMEKIRKAQISAPVRIGDKILFGVCGSDVIATKSID